MKQNEKESLSENELDVLFQKVEEIVTTMKEKERKGMKNLGKDLDSLIGSGTAFQWFNKVMES